MPAAAKGTDEASAKAFVAHYLNVLSYAAQTGDTGSLEKLGLEGCESCAGITRKIKAIYGAGGRTEGRGYAARGMQSSHSGQVWTIRLKVIALPQRSFASATAEPSESPRSETDAVFHLTKRAESWIVRDWTRV